MKLPLQDTRRAYGLVSRTLHWAMALLLGWQFLGMVIKVTVGRSPLTSFVAGSHKSAGLLLLALCLLRILWATCNARQRPIYAAAMKGHLARWGHIALYVLMALIVGHIGMALVHRYYFKDRAFARMIGA